MQETTKVRCANLLVRLCGAGRLVRRKISLHAAVSVAKGVLFSKVDSVDIILIGIPHPPHYILGRVANDNMMLFYLWSFFAFCINSVSHKP